MQPAALHCMAVIGTAIIIINLKSNKAKKNLVIFSPFLNPQNFSARKILCKSHNGQNFTMSGTNQEFHGVRAQ